MKYAFLWIMLGAVLLLGANEIFMNPPLMAPSGAAGEATLGPWAGTAENRLPVILAIAPGGAVTGMIGNANIVGGEFVSNRSWLGRTLHWRTDYMIRGSLSEPVDAGNGAAGDRFTAPVNLEGASLDGSLFLYHPGQPMPTRLRLTRSEIR